MDQDDSSKPTHFPKILPPTSLSVRDLCISSGKKDVGSSIPSDQLNPQMDQTQVTLCIKFLSALMAHPKAVMFLTPVPQTIPNYYSTIPEPTYFGNVNTMLARNGGVFLLFI